MTSAKKVLLIDDHPVVREGIASMLTGQADLHVCGTAADIATGRMAAREHAPDAILVDLSLGRESGLDLIPLLLDDCPGVSILVLSMHDENLYAKRTLQLGARGYIMKQEGAHLLLQAIRTVLAGQIYVSAAINAGFLQSLSAGPGGTGVRALSEGGPLAELSNRELQIYRLIGHGMSTKSIAAQLFLSAKTVESHRANIKTKLRVDSTLGLVAHAAEWLFRGAHGSSANMFAEDTNPGHRLAGMGRTEAHQEIPEEDDLDSGDDLAPNQH